MSTLRSLRLLGAVESASITGAQLQTYLTDTGRRSEFSVLLSMRGQSRRMAASPLTMAAIIASSAATDVVFETATNSNSIACQAVVASAVAMVTVANSVSSLTVIAQNPVAWSLFNTSAYYETNVRTVIANYAGISSAAYPTIESIITDPTAMADVAASEYAMKALVASSATTAIMAESSTAMSLVASNTSAISIVAQTAAIVPLIANSAVAMIEIVSRSVATNKMAVNSGAIKAIANSADGWATYLEGPYFAANLKTVIANLVGIAPGNYGTVNDIIADAAALSLVAANSKAVAALASSSDALTTLATSPNIGIILGSTTAMAVIGPNTTAMSSFLGASGAWAGLFSSSVAKGYIVSSTALVDIIAGNTELKTYLGTLATTATPVSVPDGVQGVFQAFNGGQPDKVLVLSAKEVGIAATFSEYKLNGATLAGTAAGITLRVSSTTVTAHVAAYTGLTWDFLGIGITGATKPIITYVDMT